MKNLAISIVTFVCLATAVGCSRFEDKNAIVAKLCDERGKHTVYRRVQADGVLIENPDRDYVGFGALYLFNRTGLKYVEVPSTLNELSFIYPPQDVDSEQLKILSSGRFIKIFLDDHDSNYCIKWRSSIKSSGGWGEDQLIKAKQCIAAVSVEESTARYIATSKAIEDPVEEINSIHFSIHDTTNGEVVAEAVNFYFTSGTGKFRGTAQCRGYGTKFVNQDFSVFGLIIKTIKNQESDQTKH